MWIWEDQPVTAMLDFIELAKSHSGQNMVKPFVDTLEHYAIAHKGGTSSIEIKKKTYRYLDWLNHRWQRNK